MPTCYKCGEHITFRHVDGVLRPIHDSGHCSGTDAYDAVRGIKSREAHGRVWKCIEPNARCPVCYDPVFFIQPRNGGRVFFDDLAPDWPKHPCTDLGRTPSIYNPPRTSVIAPKSKAGWHLVEVREIKREGNQTYVSGVCYPLGIDVEMVSGPEAAMVNAPVFIKPFGDSGVFETSYVQSQSDVRALRSATRLFFPVIGVSASIWKKATDGSASAQCAVGWAYSFGQKTEEKRNYWAAAYWYGKAASSGNRIAMNNLGVIHLKGLIKGASMSEAKSHLLNSALQMTPQAFGHLADIFGANQADFKAGEIARLLRAVQCHLILDEYEQTVSRVGVESKQAGPSKGHCYSPEPIERYCFIDAIQRIKGFKDSLPLWNLFWLSSPEIDECLEYPSQWHRKIGINVGVFETMLSDLDSKISGRISLRDSLCLHPRQFLDAIVDFDAREFMAQKRNSRWKVIVMERAQLAATRIDRASVGL